MRRIGGLFTFILLSTSAAQVQAKAVFTGRVVASPCRASDDVTIIEGDIRSGDSITCQISGNNTLHIIETTIPRGANFRASAEGPALAWARTSCDPSGGVFSDTDCNRCANDVADQFLALFTDYEQDEFVWDYREYGIYRPSSAKPAEFTNGNADSHVQGFLRTNSEVFPFAGTYSRASESNRGFIFVVEDEDGHLELEMLHRSWHRHPSGAALLGERIWFGDQRPGVSGYVVRSLMPDWQGHTEQGYFELPDAFEGRTPSVGGGLGLAALASGYLLVTMGPGGNDEDPVVDFFYVEGKTNPATGAPYGLGRIGGDDRYAVDVLPLARWSLKDATTNNQASGDEFKYSENLSVITECGSGDVYVINATGTAGLFGSGFYRLSRVRWETLPDHNLPVGARSGIMGPQLQPVAWGKHAQDSHKCHPRSAATFWTNEAHELELYCSEFSAVDGERRMDFTRRRPS